MGKFEKIILALVCIALILTLQLIEGGAFLLFITALLLSLLYFPFGFLLIHRIGLKKMFKSETYQAIKSGHIIIAVVAGISFSMMWIGILFKMLRYEGSEFMLISGLIPCLIILVFAFIKYNQTKTALYKNMLLRAVFFGAIGAVLFMSSDLTIVRYQYRNHPDYVKAYEQYTANPTDPTLKQNLSNEYQKIIDPRNE
jgi:hypothetical protein